VINCDIYSYGHADAAGFDAVINPVIIEPVVQFTIYMKVKYIALKQP
jgi:hypothetical protein